MTLAAGDTAGGSFEKAPSSLYMIALMSAVATLCGVLIVITYESTLQAIKRNQTAIMGEAVFEVLPGAAKQVIFEVQPGGELTVASGLDGTLPKLFAGYNAGGTLVGVALEASGRGYAGDIHVLYAYDPAQEQITGFKVLECRETPGLGDKIMHDTGFLSNFKDLDVALTPDKTAPAHPIETVRPGTKKTSWQIDAISGATISSKAVGRMLREGTREMLPLVQRNLDQLRKGA